MKLKQTATYRQIFFSKLGPNRGHPQSDSRVLDGFHSSKCSFLRAIEFQITNEELFSGAQVSRSKITN